MENYSQQPYYDRYSGNTEHRKAGYTRVLAIPGRAEQASEFNEIQSIQRDYLERLGDSIYKNGHVVSGCEISVQDNVVHINSGRIYLDGLIREVEEVNLPIKGVGSEKVVAKVVTSIVTATQDPTLRDPAQTAENYNQVGANREKQVVEFSIYDGTGELGAASVVYELHDGVILKEVVTDNYSMFTDILAGRTFDENGNYRVEGLNLQQQVENLDTQVKVYVSAGKAYIKGYEITKPAMSFINLNKSTSTRFIQSESAYYKSSVKKYRLTNGPIAKMSNFTASVLVTGERKFRGGTKGGADSLSNTPVQSIVAVYTKTPSGDKQTQYQLGRDFTLFNDSVDWSVTGDDAQEPSSGTTYYVDYIYNYSMQEGTDYTLSNDGDVTTVTLQNGGNKPVENSLMYFSYDFTLARRDLILLDSSGKLSVLEGTPDKYDDLLTPYNGSNDYLELGYVNIYPTNALNPSEANRLAKVVNSDKIRLTQDNFITMLQRINALEDSIASLDMERDIEANEDTTSLTGYFTDSFENINKSDLTYQDTKSGIAYTACIDYDMNELTTSNSINNIDLTVDEGSSDTHGVWGNIISAPYELELAVQQTHATGTMLVNPYASYGPLCKINLSPATDNWVDQKQVVVNNTAEEKTYTTDTKTYSHGYWSRSANKNLRGYLRTETKTTTTYEGTTKSKRTNSSVANTVYEYMREKEVQVEGIAFGANSKSVRGVFNGKPIDLVPTGTTQAGTPYQTGGKSYTTVNADENGHITCKFKVPAKTPCGKASFQMISTNNLGETHTGTATYTANGTLVTTTITNTDVYTSRYKVLTEVDNIYANDPLAQSFIVDSVYDRNISRIGLYFASKSNTRDVVVQVRNMVNGYPGEKVLAEVSLSPKEVNIPRDKNVPVATNVDLNQPVYCNANTYYCFVVLSDSNEYSMYINKMGDNRLGTKTQQIVNPYATGVLFSSSNASTWTAHQDTDMKFDLYRSRYTGNGSIVFNDVQTKEITGLMLDAAYEVDGSNVEGNTTGLRWFYRFTKKNVKDSDSDWLPIDTLVFRDLQAYAERVDLKAEFTTNYSTSPFIAKDRVSLRTFTDAKNAVYISKSLDEANFPNEYQAMKISYECALPTNTSMTCYYMDEEDGQWVELKTDSSTITTIGSSNTQKVTLDTSTVDEEFTRYTWNVNQLNVVKTGKSHTGSKFFKFRIDLNTTLAYNRPRVRKLACIFKDTL